MVGLFDPLRARRVNACAGLRRASLDHHYEMELVHVLREYVKCLRARQGLIDMCACMSLSLTRTRPQS